MPPSPGRLRAWLRPGPESNMGARTVRAKRVPQPKQMGPGQRPPKGRARAPLVLGPFAETQGPRRAGPKPRKNPFPLDRTWEVALPNIHISMTTFVDFVFASGPPKLAAVMKAKIRYQTGYDSATDFYTPLREWIIAVTYQNLTGTETLDSMRSTFVNLNTRNSHAYQECIAGFTQWWRGKNIVWNKALRSEWTQGRLAIRIAPELGVSIRGEPHIIKLYFKKQKPSKQRLQAMVHLLNQLNGRAQTPVTVGILDMRRGQLHSPTRDDSVMEPLLAGEAAAFQTMWDRV